MLLDTSKDKPNSLSDEEKLDATAVKESKVTINLPFSPARSPSSKKDQEDDMHNIGTSLNWEILIAW